MVGTYPSSAGGVSSIPSQGAKTPHASEAKKTEHKQQKQYCNKFNKDFLNGPLQKKKSFKKSHLVQ